MMDESDIQDKFTDKFGKLEELLNSLDEEENNQNMINKKKSIKKNKSMKKSGNNKPKNVENSNSSFISSFEAEKSRAVEDNPSTVYKTTLPTAEH